MKSIGYVPFTIRRYERIIASGVILAAVAVLTVVFLIPNIRKANEIISQRTALQKRVASLQKKQSALKTIDIETYKSTYKKLQQVLPERKEFVSLFSALDTLEGITGVAILRTDFLAMEATTSATRATGSLAYTMPIEFEIVGERGQMAQFLEAVTSLSTRLIAIEEMQLQYVDRTLVKAQIRATAFYYTPPSKIGSVDAQLPSISRESDALIKQLASISFQESPIAIEDDISQGKKDLFE